MRNKVYWGLGVLMILLIATTTVVVIRSNNETQRLKDELAQLELQKKAEKTPDAVDFSDTKPPDEPGFVWIRHGDHWDKVPIDNPIEHHDVSNENPRLEDEFDFLDFAVKLPTDDELPIYTERDLSIVIHKALMEKADAQYKYEAVMENMRQTLSKLTDDKIAGHIDAKRYWKMLGPLTKQKSELFRNFRAARNERTEQINRIEQYRDTLK